MTSCNSAISWSYICGSGVRDITESQRYRTYCDGDGKVDKGDVGGAEVDGGVERWGSWAESDLREGSAGLDDVADQDIGSVAVERAGIGSVVELDVVVIAERVGAVVVVVGGGSKRSGLRGADRGGGEPDCLVVFVWVLIF